MATYSAAVALYLAYVGVVGGVCWHLSMASGRHARDPHSSSWKRLANYRTA